MGECLLMGHGGSGSLRWNKIYEDTEIIWNLIAGGRYTQYDLKKIANLNLNFDFLKVEMQGQFSYSHDVGGSVTLYTGNHLSYPIYLGGGNGDDSTGGGSPINISMLWTRSAVCRHSSYFYSINLAPNGSDTEFPLRFTTTSKYGKDATYRGRITVWGANM